MTWMLSHILAQMLLGFLFFYVGLSALSLLARGGARLTAALRALAPM